jgi:hypothetical protein
MSTAQRVSRGFHRLALFLAAIPLLVGGAASAYVALDHANSAKATHDQQAAKLVCAQTALNSEQQLKLLGLPPLPSGYHLESLGSLDSEQIDLQKLGCPGWPQTTTIGEVLHAKPPEALSYVESFLPPPGIGFVITLAVTLAVYVVVRAIGWVIGGFAAS